MEGQRAGEGGARQKSFPRDQERSISTIRYFVSSARLLCAGDRIRKSSAREEAPQLPLARQRVRGGERGERIPGRISAGGSKRETRIVFRPGKLVIDTAARTSAELSRARTRSVLSLFLSLSLSLSLFLSPCFWRSTGDKNIFAVAPMLTTSAATAPVNVCHYCRLLLKIPLPLPHVSRCARDRSGDLSRRSLNCPYAPVLREESWLPAKHRSVFLSFRTRRRRCIYMYIYNPVNRTPLCILRRVRRVVEPRSRGS